MKPKQMVSVTDHYTTATYDAQVLDTPRRPILYTADGKPLGHTIGFVPPKVDKK